MLSTYYATKWSEAKSLINATKKHVVDVIFEDIFVMFGIHREIVTNKGDQFTSNLVKKITEKYQIKHRTSTPYHLQANGEVESTNTILQGILTKTIDQEDRLSKSLWDYERTWKDTTELTTCEMVYGKQVLFPFEFHVKTYKIEAELGMDLTKAQK